MRPASCDAAIWSEPFAGFDAFADACDDARTASEVESLLATWSLRLGFRYIILTTHCEASALSGFGVRAHNLPASLAAAFFSGPRGGARLFFDLAHRGADAVSWTAAVLAKNCAEAERRWLDKIAAADFSSGVAQAVRVSLTPASCILCWGDEPPRAGASRLMFRIASHAFCQIVALQRSRLGERDPLTERERQCLTLATLGGLRPRQVAQRLGISIHTVRSMRQRAHSRLGARSQEEAVWRLMMTGQLFGAPLDIAEIEGPDKLSRKEGHGCHRGS